MNWPRIEWLTSVVSLCGIVVVDLNVWITYCSIKSQLQVLWIGMLDNVKLVTITIYLLIL